MLGKNKKEIPANCMIGKNTITFLPTACENCGYNAACSPTLSGHIISMHLESQLDMRGSLLSCGHKNRMVGKHKHAARYNPPHTCDCW